MCESEKCIIYKYIGDSKIKAYKILGRTSIQPFWALLENNYSIELNICRWCAPSSFLIIDNSITRERFQSNAELKMILKQFLVEVRCWTVHKLKPMLSNSSWWRVTNSKQNTASNYFNEFQDYWLSTKNNAWLRYWNWIVDRFINIIRKSFYQNSCKIYLISFYWLFVI